MNESVQLTAPSSCVHTQQAAEKDTAHIAIAVTKATNRKHGEISKDEKDSLLLQDIIKSQK